MITVAGMFNSRADAGGVVERLRAAGIAEEHFALLGPGAADSEVEEQVLTVETAEPHAGEKVGRALGRGLGIAGGSFALMPRAVLKELIGLAHRYDVEVSTGASSTLTPLSL